MAQQGSERARGAGCRESATLKHEALSPPPTPHPTHPPTSGDSSGSKLGLGRSGGDSSLRLRIAVTAKPAGGSGEWTREGTG